MLIQFLLIAGVAVAAILAIRILPGDRSLAVKRIFALLFALAAILAIIFPDVLTTIANFLGVGRGVDLLLYVSVIAALLFAVATVRAKARTDARISELARAVALMEARLREGLVEDLPGNGSAESYGHTVPPNHNNRNDTGDESSDNQNSGTA